MNVAVHTAVRGCLTALLCLCALPALAQRMQFATPVADPYQPASGAYNPYPANPYPASPYPAAPGGYPASPYPQPAPVYGPAPAYGPAPTYGPAAPATPFDPYALGPGGPLPAPGATPYNAAPYSATPNTLFPDTSSMSSPSTWLTPQPNGMRFIREIRGEYTWLTPGGDEGLGVTDLELSATMQFPWFQGKQPPLLLTPGFVFHFWDGPVSMGPGTADMPPRTYDAYLDTAWNPDITPWLSAELDVRVGMYTDFDHVTTDSLRILGAGVGVVRFSPVWKAKLGVWYIDRNKVKLLPAVGVVWTPNEDTHWELFFPRPKLANRLTMVGSTTLWWYVAGEYGGGAWSLRRDDGSGDDVDYNDVRISLGLDWANPSGFKGMVEIGYAFERELFYRSQVPTPFHPNNTFMLRAGLAY